MKVLHSDSLFKCHEKNQIAREALLGWHKLAKGEDMDAMATTKWLIDRQTNQNLPSCLCSGWDKRNIACFTEKYHNVLRPCTVKLKNVVCHMKLHVRNDFVYITSIKVRC
jgi:hypothetical protein